MTEATVLRACWPVNPLVGQQRHKNGKQRETHIKQYINREINLPGRTFAYLRAAGCRSSHFADEQPAVLPRVNSDAERWPQEVQGEGGGSDRTSSDEK